MNHEPDIERLLDFADLVDRGETPFFVGRHDELRRLARQAELVVTHWRRSSDVSGRTIVITGCPGMGKSALLRHFAATRCNQPDDPASPLAVVMDVADLHDVGNIADAFRKAAREKVRMRRLLDAIGADVTKRLKAERTMDALAEAYYGEARGVRPVALLVDEIQNVDSRCRDALSKLHNGTLGLPVLPIFAGLNDSLDALRRHGISRLGDEARINLQPLSQADSRRAAHELFERFRVAGEATVKERWVSSIAADSLGFPQHLHVGLKAAARVLAEHEGTAMADGLRSALAKGAAARTAYYRNRLNSEVRAHGKALVDLVGAVAGSDSPMGRGDLLAHAFKRMRETSAFGKPTEEDAVRFVDDLIHDGVLQENAEGTGYVVPIPSMQKWILDDYARGIGYGTAPGR